MAFRIPDSVAMASQYRASGITPFDRTTKIRESDLAADELVAIFKFGPHSGKLWYLIVDVPDLDGGTALVFNLELVDIDGNTIEILDSGSTSGQAGATVAVVVLDGSELPPECGDAYLAMRVTTAAGTPAEGEVRVVGLFGANV